MQSGIYFLFQKGELIYIGKTTKWPFRLKQHISMGLVFDKSKFIEYPDGKLKDMEMAFIDKLKPTLNVAYNTHNRKRKPTKRYFQNTFCKKQYMKLRKLTEKSIIGFGKYRYTMVKSLRPQQIASLYFTCSHINFFDDVLERAKITEEHRIEKPGCGDFAQFCRDVYPEDHDAFMNHLTVHSREKKIKILQQMDRLFLNKSRNRKNNQW